MLTEGWTLVVVDFESVWHVDLESLLVELKDRQKAHVASGLKLLIVSWTCESQ